MANRAGPVPAGHRGGRAGGAAAPSRECLLSHGVDRTEEWAARQRGAPTRSALQAASTFRPKKVMLQSLGLVACGLCGDGEACAGSTFIGAASDSRTHGGWNMAIREATCPTCGYYFNETQSAWDRAWTTGRCPKCRKFLDPTREAEARNASRAATTASRAIDQRRKRIFAALGLVAPGILLYVLGFPFRMFGVILMVSGVVLLIRMLFHTTSEQAHQDLERKTDLDTFGKKRIRGQDRERQNPGVAAEGNGPPASAG